MCDIDGISLEEDFRILLNCYKELNEKKKQLQQENERLKHVVFLRDDVKNENQKFALENDRLKQENEQLNQYNERMKEILKKIIFVDEYCCDNYTELIGIQASKSKKILDELE